MARMLRASSPESEDFGVLLNFQDVETCILQPLAKRIGVYGHQCVADMNDPHEPALKTVTPYKEAARLQNSEYLLQDFVL